MGLQQMHDVIVIPFTDPSREDGIDIVGVLMSCQKRGIPCIQSQLWLADGPAQILPLGVIGDRDRHPHILSKTGVNALRRHVGMTISHGTGNVAGSAMGDDVLTQHGRGHFPLGQINQRAASGLAPLSQGRHQSADRQHAHDRIRKGFVGHQGDAVCVARNRSQSGGLL